MSVPSVAANVMVFDDRVTLSPDPSQKMVALELEQQHLEKN